jgi:hypothetical protein
MQALGIQCDADLDSFDIMCINDAVLAFRDRVNHFASYHDELIGNWMMVRKPETIDGVLKPVLRGVVTHGQRAGEFTKRVHVFQHGGGTSAMFGALVAERLGYERIILCGCGLTKEGRFCEPPWATTHDYWETDDGPAWIRARDAGELSHCRSMSGRTREVLGAPPPEWYFQPKHSPEG